jgi:IS4 transposase
VAKRHIGRPLDKNVNLRGIIVEVWGKLNLPGKKSLEVRLIGFRFPLTKKYRWYVTNIPNSMVLAEWIYPIYRLRWQIELFFKSIKSMLHADQITSENENIVLVTAYRAYA